MDFHRHDWHQKQLESELLLAEKKDPVRPVWCSAVETDRPASIDLLWGNQLPCADAHAINLFCVGLSHHRTSVGARERFAGHGETDCLLRNSGCTEALVLSTCNRVEVYGAADAPVQTEKIARCVARELDCELKNVAAFYRYEAAECAQHLFRVTSGLESMVIGETEILGQAKKAYEFACTSGAATSDGQAIASAEAPATRRRGKNHRRTCGGLYEFHFAQP